MKLRSVNFGGKVIQVEGIIFDLGGVIINLDYSASVKAFEKNAGVLFSSDHLGSPLQLDFFSLYEKGKISTIECHQAFCEHFKVKLSLETFRASLNAMLLDLPQSRLELLKKLSKIVPIFLLSNINEIHLEQMRNHYDWRDENFKKVYYSHLVGLRKPDPEIFKLVLKENGLTAEKTLFLDDTLIHIKSAEKLGINVHNILKGEDIVNLFQWEDYNGISPVL
jgi:FMN phosphatase YigB (HAD superfamily)